MSGRIHFRYQSRGLRVAQARTKHTGNTPSLPQRNANSAIEFSGILPDGHGRGGIKFRRDTLSIHARPSFPTDPIACRPPPFIPTVALSTSLWWTYFTGSETSGQESGLRQKESLLLIRGRFFQDRVLKEKEGKSRRIRKLRESWRNWIWLKGISWYEGREREGRVLRNFPLLLSHSCHFRPRELCYWVLPLSGAADVFYDVEARRKLPGPGGRYA